VRVHEHVDAKFAKVTLRCLGYPTEGTHPDECAFSLLVPVAELPKWPLGVTMRMAIAA
jgi:hypothetical protein